MMSQDVVVVKGVSKTYSIRENQANSIKGIFLNIFKNKGKKRKIKALNDINFSVKKGEAIGIVGRNGSGKTTLMNIILGGIRPDEGGLVTTKGKIIKINKRFDSIIEFAGLEDFIETPVKFYSKGMKSRLTFAVAMQAEADIFLLDEFFGGVGDEEFKHKSNKIFLEKLDEGKTIIIVSHGKNILKKFCKETIWIHKGELKKRGDTTEILKEYKAISTSKKK